MACLLHRRVRTAMKLRMQKDRVGTGRPVRLLLICTSVFLFPAASRAQYLLQTGSPTFTNAEPVEMGFINVANGNLHIEIPLASTPQRGSLPYGARLVYDSRIWQTSGSVWSPSNVSLSRTCWRFVTPGGGTANYAQSSTQCVVNNTFPPQFYTW